ncbi:hypothetical protein LXL04_016618 [Taraxacum kok-saghyz]
MYDSMFDVYQNAESAKELWNSFEYKYMSEDASSKKFLVSNFMGYKMVDTRPVMEQYHEMLWILGQFTQHNLKMDESISIAVIMEKLPHLWREFKHIMRHNKEELNLVQLRSHLRIEKSLRTQELDNNPKVKNEIGSSCVYGGSCIFAKKNITFFRKKDPANCNDVERFRWSRSRFFESNNGFGDIRLCYKVGEFSGSRANSMEETGDVLLDSQNRYEDDCLKFTNGNMYQLQRRYRERERESRSREPEYSQTVNFFKKPTSGGLKIAQIQARSQNKISKKQFFFPKTLHISPHNTYLKVLLKKFENNCKKNKKSCTYTKIKKNIIFFFLANWNDYERFGESRSRFFERNNGLEDIGNWGSSRVFGNI